MQHILSWHTLKIDKTFRSKFKVWLWVSDKDHPPKLLQLRWATLLTSSTKLVVYSINLLRIVRKSSIEQSMTKWRSPMLIRRLGFNRAVIRCRVGRSIQRIHRMLCQQDMWRLWIISKLTNFLLKKSCQHLWYRKGQHQFMYYLIRTSVPKQEIRHINYRIWLLCNSQGISHLTM